MIASGINPQTGLVEIIELPNHPFFIGVQYHPELKSTVKTLILYLFILLKRQRILAEANKMVDEVNMQGEMSS